jgi:monofunctional biosynthetic peptidoglycan transglycosylase
MAAKKKSKNDKKTDEQPIKSKFSRLMLTAKWGAVLIAALLLVEVGYVLGLMPDWDQFIHGPIQKSSIIQQYEYKQTLHSGWPPLRWHPVPMFMIPKHLTRAVVVAEDSRFYQHKGFDQEAIKHAIEYNLSKGRIVYGASTISQQTVKNFFLTTSRNPLRKLHEAILTYAMEKNVGKARILEIYLNISEFGRGVYGVEAASRHYFGKSVSEITPWEALDLAATLPAPVHHNPSTRTDFFLKHRAKIKGHLGL